MRFCRLLIDDTDSDSVPLQELIRHLEKAGWSFRETSSSPVIEGSMERDRIEITSVEHEVANSGSLDLDYFLRGNDSNGLAHLEVIQWKE